MANYNLTEGALEIIMRDGDVKQPIFQLLARKKIHSHNTHNQRYSALLSDGMYKTSHAMFQYKSSEVIELENISMFSIIRIKRHITSVVNDSEKGNVKVLIILDMDVVVSGEVVGKQIGCPIPLQDCLSKTRNSQLRPSSSNGRTHFQVS